MLKKRIIQEIELQELGSSVPATSGGLARVQIYDNHFAAGGIVGAQIHNDYFSTKAPIILGAAVIKDYLPAVKAEVPAELVEDNKAYEEARQVTQAALEEVVVQHADAEETEEVENEFQLVKSAAGIPAAQNGSVFGNAQFALSQNVVAASAGCIAAFELRKSYAKVYPVYKKIASIAIPIALGLSAIPVAGIIGAAMLTPYAAGLALGSGFSALCEKAYNHNTDYKITKNLIGLGMYGLVTYNASISNGIFSSLFKTSMAANAIKASWECKIIIGTAAFTAIALSTTFASPALAVIANPVVSTLLQMSLDIYLKHAESGNAGISQYFASTISNFGENYYSYVTTCALKLRNGVNAVYGLIKKQLPSDDISNDYEFVDLDEVPVHQAVVLQSNNAFLRVINYTTAKVTHVYNFVQNVHSQGLRLKDNVNYWNGLVKEINAVHMDCYNVYAQYYPILRTAVSACVVAGVVSSALYHPGIAYRIILAMGILSAIPQIAERRKEFIGVAAYGFAAIGAIAGAPLAMPAFMAMNSSILSDSNTWDYLNRQLPECLRSSQEFGVTTPYVAVAGVLVATLTYSMSTAGALAKIALFSVPAVVIPAHIVLGCAAGILAHTMSGEKDAVMDGVKNYLTTCITDLPIRAYECMADAMGQVLINFPTLKLVCEKIMSKGSPLAGLCTVESQLG